MSGNGNGKADMWNRLEKTDPARTKQFQRGGGFRGTAINATYILKRLTEEFGPCGKGWRFVLDDERYEPGHTLKNGDKVVVHIVRGHLEYILDGTWHSTSPQFGQTMFVDENKHGPLTDEEAPKKSITDCISKCAVLLGIGADVHLGLFDDNKYVNARKQEEAAENAPEGEAVPDKPDRKAAANKWADQALHDLQAIKTGERLSTWHRENANAIAALRGFNEAKHGRLVDAIQKRTADLSTLVAG